MITFLAQKEAQGKTVSVSFDSGVDLNGAITVTEVTKGKYGHVSRKLISVQLTRRECYELARTIQTATTKILDK